MTTYRQNLISRRLEVTELIDSICETDSIEYKQGLYDELSRIKDLLADPNLDADATTDPTDPFETVTRAVT